MSGNTTNCDCVCHKLGYIYCDCPTHAALSSPEKEATQ